MGSLRNIIIIEFIKIMFCCRGREKRNENELPISKKEMVERYIL